MIWYDKIAILYDFFTNFIYKEARVNLIQNLKIKNGDRVLVIACGTGQSFKLIEDIIGDSGEIIALDYSKGMLKFAQKVVDANNFGNVKLLNMDARDLNIENLSKNNIISDFDIIIGELAFSVIPNWQTVMENSYLLLKENGKIGLLDWYREKNDFLTRIINFLAEADITRDTARAAEKIFTKFSVIERFIFNNVYIGIGVK